MKTPDTIQRLADLFAVPNDTIIDFLMWHDGEMHEYGKRLQGTILDLEFDLNHIKEKLAVYEEQWQPSKQEQIDDLAEQLNKMEGRANALEEWLTEYRDQLKKENVYHKNTGVINAINELLDEL